MQHTDQAHRQAQKNPETLTEADACSVQRSCSPVDFIGDVGSGRLGDSSWLKDVAKAERLMGVYEFFDWYQEFRKRLYAKRASYLETLAEADACSVQRSCSPVDCMESVGGEGLKYFSMNLGDEFLHLWKGADHITLSRREVSDALEVVTYWAQNRLSELPRWSVDQQKWLP